MDEQDRRAGALDERLPGLVQARGRQRCNEQRAGERFSVGRSGPANADRANCDIFLSRTSCAGTGRHLDSLARRARSASRTKPSSRAVGGSRRSTRTVDESEIDSANETAAFGPPFRFCTPAWSTHEAGIRRSRRQSRHDLQAASQATPRAAVSYWTAVDDAWERLRALLLLTALVSGRARQGPATRLAGPDSGLPLRPR